MRAVALHERDDVANLLATSKAGDEVTIEGAVRRTVRARTAIPFAHKMALHELEAGARVHKYGVPIGTLTAAVYAGDHVHVHNLSGVAGRAPEDPQRFAADALRTLGLSLARAAGASEEAARDMIDAMVEADLRGVSTHGMERLLPYLERIRSGAVDGRATPAIVRAGSVIAVDGRNAIGHHAMRRACEELLAGVADNPLQIAAVRNSNHFGFAGYYATLLAQQGLLALCSSNGTPCVAPPGGISPFFSNDPLAIAAADGNLVVEVDLALSTTSRANVRHAYERGTLIPTDWALGPNGLPTDDPAAALAGTMLPFGGERGFALLFGVELLAGVLGGGAVADEVASKERAHAIEGTSHVALTIDVRAFPGGSAFGTRLRDLVERMRGVPRTVGALVPRYPGERRWRLRAQRLRDGIPLDPATVRALRTEAEARGLGMPA